MQPESTTSSINQHTDEAVKSFVHAWAQGPRPQIERIVENWVGPGRKALFLKLLKIEITLRGNIGERPTESEYRSRFPDQVDLVSAAFAESSVRDELSGGTTVRAEHALEQVLVWLAFEGGFASRDALLGALAQWTLDTSQPLGQVLRETGCLDSGQLAALERRLPEHVARQGGDLAGVLETFAALGPSQRDFIKRVSRLLSRTGAEVGDRTSSTLRFPSDGDGVGLATTSMPARPARADDQTGDPTRVGRYRVVKPLARGGFGRVYLGYDDDLDRSVAIKVPNPERIDRPEDIEAYLAEARNLARLDHPHIVPVYDVGRTADGLCYIVSKVVEGRDLAARMKHGPFSPHEAAELVAALAEALHYAHIHGLVHRDVKPANILIDSAGRPVLVDFGLALKDEEFGKSPALVGTPAYMSPEQARGEGHRVDGRSDVFSLGVVFYELLTGRRPFGGGTIQEVLDAVANTEARPPRQIVDAIPRELERICLKALAKRASERYSTASDLADDLRTFIRCDGGRAGAATASVTTELGASRNGAAPATASARSDPELRTIRIVPKGLRSFDEHDADFFLELVSGPRDRDGVPESLRFWKNRIEAVDPDKAFRVGLLYGPSGCGKSSLVKAGLLPRLAGHVRPVYVEATAEETEARLSRGLSRACPELPAGCGLAESLAELRRGRVLPVGAKVLVVLDQFEQWLFAQGGEPRAPLVDALRQCDGGRVQALILVRDDFWLASSRFMRALEVRLVEGENSALVDLFDPPHARVVLMAFGRAYGTLPAWGDALGAEHRAFLDRSVDGLAQDGKIVPVRLAMFAEMVKGKPWVPATLRAVGGTRGVGATFLEETFGAPTASPEHRLHQKAARAVLMALLPESGTDIKGQMRSEGELRDAAGYAGRPADFDDLIHILDTELRLITPTDPEGIDAGNSSSGAVPARGRHYQLAHDYLVHSLRDWLTRKRRETRKGRAELALEERASLWVARPEHRNLPSLAEWARIRLLSDRADWTTPQRRMMAIANRRYSIKMAWVGMLLAMAVIVLGAGAGWVEGRRRRTEARALVSQLMVAEWDRLPEILVRMRPDLGLWREEVARIAVDPSRPDDDRLRARLALARHDPAIAADLVDDLARSNPQRLPIIWHQIEPWKDRLCAMLWERLDAADVAAGRRRFACALARGDPSSPRWAAAAPHLVDALLDEEDPLFLTGWVEQLRPVGEALFEPLLRACLDHARSDERRLAAAAALAGLGRGPSDRLDEVLLNGDDRQAAILFRLVAQDPAGIEARMRRALDEPAVTGAKGLTLNRETNAALTLARLGRWETVWPLLDAAPHPALRTRLIRRLCHAVPPSELINGLTGPEAPPIRQAVLLALGGYPEEQLSAADRSAILDAVRRLFNSDPDSGVHAGAEWLLRHWDRAAELDELTKALAGRPPAGNWFVNHQGQTMVVVRDPNVSEEESPGSKAHREPGTVRQDRRNGRRFAIAAHEVTVEEFRRFKPDHDYARIVTPGIRAPVGMVTWYDAVRYCRWLTEQEGLPESQQCYPKDVGPNMQVPDDFLERRGYRLPTGMEWEDSCRAGTSTRRFFGDDDSALLDYDWFNRNSDDHLWPVGLKKPNPLGLFDLYGNCSEWCHEAIVSMDPRRTGTPVGADGLAPVADDSRQIRGGSYRSTFRELSSEFSDQGRAIQRLSFFGFRMAKTVE